MDTTAQPVEEKPPGHAPNPWAQGSESHGCVATADSGDVGDKQDSQAHASHLGSGDETRCACANRANLGDAPGATANPSRRSNARPIGRGGSTSGCNSADRNTILLDTPATVTSTPATTVGRADTGLVNDVASRASSACLRVGSAMGHLARGSLRGRPCFVGTWHLRPNVPPVQGSEFTSGEAPADQTLNPRAVLQRYTARFPVPDGADLHTEFTRKVAAPANGCGSQVDGVFAVFHHATLTRDVFLLNTTC